MDNPTVAFKNIVVETKLKNNLSESEITSSILNKCESLEGKGNSKVNINNLLIFKHEENIKVFLSLADTNLTKRVKSLNETFFMGSNFESPSVTACTMQDWIDNLKKTLEKNWESLQVPKH